MLVDFRVRFPECITTGTSARERHEQLSNNTILGVASTVNVPFAYNGALDVVIKHLAQLIMGFAQSQVLQLFLERRRLRCIGLPGGRSLGGRCKVVGQCGNCEVAGSCMGVKQAKGVSVLYMTCEAPISRSGCSSPFNRVMAVRIFGSTSDENRIIRPKSCEKED